MNQFLRIPGNSTVHADAIDILQEKISVFETTSENIAYDGGADLPENVYRLSTLRYNNSGKLTLIEKVKRIQLIDENFSIENGLLTPTMKVKRKKVTEKYKKQLENLY